MAIYITGDTHGDFQRFGSKYFPQQKEMSREDYVVIAGDFGGLWDGSQKDQYWLDWLNKKPFTTLFVDGNHENFDLLYSYPVNEWNGGKVHIIKPDIIHLMRGQVFELEGNTIFIFGGATSIDKYMRTEGLTWWALEMPTHEELDEGIANLKRYNNKVDYIITHSCGERALMYPPLRTRNFQMGRYPENQMLAYFEDIVDYKKWYFGHYHLDGRLNDKMTVLYQEIVPLGE